MDDKDSEEGLESGDALYELIDLQTGPKAFKRDLFLYWKVYLVNPTTSIAAFEALYRIGMHYWDDDVDVKRNNENFGMDPLSEVCVPWWVVHILGKLYKSYLTAGPGVTFGESMKMEGGGQGKHQAKAELEKNVRDAALAGEVKSRKSTSKELSYEKIYEQISEEVPDVSPDMVKRAWLKFSPVLK